ncbi:MAG: GNAT family N-acetyltransferase [Actinomycetota bacterium]
MSLDVSVDCTERCFELPDWPELLQRDPNRQIFAYPDWNRVWWDEFRDGKDLFLLTMGRAGETAAIVPLYRKTGDGRRLLRFIGGIDLTDYLGPICSLGDRRDVADTLVEWLRTTDVEWDEFDAHNMPVPLGFADFLVERADAAGFDFKIEQEETAAVLPLPRTWGDYLNGLRPKDRHEVRRKRRRLERDHPDAHVRTSTEETIDVDFKTFVEMHRGAEGHKGHFMRPEIATFFDRLVREFMPKGWLRLDFLEVGDRPIASTFSFQIERKFYLYNSAYEPDAARLSPGLVLVSELVKRAIGDGLELFDFLRGPERYKYELGATAVPLNNVRVFNSAIRETTSA